MKCRGFFLALATVLIPISLDASSAATSPAAADSMISIDGYVRRYTENDLITNRWFHVVVTAAPSSDPADYSRGGVGAVWRNATLSVQISRVRQDGREVPFYSYSGPANIVAYAYNGMTGFHLGGFISTGVEPYESLSLGATFWPSDNPFSYMNGVSASNCDQSVYPWDYHFALTGDHFAGTHIIKL